MKNIETYSLTIKGTKNEKNISEDSLCYRYISKKNMGIIGCFDGCGGSGSTVYNDVEAWTAARIASHICGEVTIDWFDSLYPNESIFIDNYLKMIRGELLSVLEKIHKQVILNQKSMIKPLPTTISTILFSLNDRKVNVNAVWAGDSRAYILTNNGLQQITIDDTTVDPYDTLTKSSGPFNYANPCFDFYLSSNIARVNLPCILMVATDGCFDFFHPSPVRFEETILESVMNSSCLNELKKSLYDEIFEVTGDDFTLQMVLIGFSDYESIKKYFYNYYEIFLKNYKLPLDEMEKKDDFESIKNQWQQYKKNYLKYAKRNKKYE